MMSMLASSMPRTGGDYVWVSRILSPPLALVSNFGAALSATIGATFWARYFPVFALGPILSTLGVTFNNSTLLDWGKSFQTDRHESGWICTRCLGRISAQLDQTASLRTPAVTL
jgi:amino acid transporter